MKAFSRLPRPSPQHARQSTLRTTLPSKPRPLRTTTTTTSPRPSNPQQTCIHRPQQRRAFSHHPSRADRPQPADDPNFHSILDNPPQLIRAGGRRHGPGLIILAIIPLTAFVLGTWQVKRLEWKTELIAKCEDRLVRPPLPLPPRIDAEAVGDSFDYRRVETEGRYRHDQEMLVGPRMRDGEDGYMVITPLEREGGSTILVNRGWIPKRLRDQRSRSRDSLPRGVVRVEGMLRKPWKKNMFTPENRPDKGEFYFPDVAQMASLTGAQPVWVEATMDPDYMQIMEYEQKGIPLGRAAEVNLRNNHAQYIFTWYSLCLATSIMLWMVVKKPPTDVTKRVRMNKHW